MESSSQEDSTVLVRSRVPSYHMIQPSWSLTAGSRVIQLLFDRGNDIQTFATLKISCLQMRLQYRVLESDNGRTLETWPCDTRQQHLSNCTTTSNFETLEEQPWVLRKARPEATISHTDTETTATMATFLDAQRRETNNLIADAVRMALRGDSNTRTQTPVPTPPAAPVVWKPSDIGFLSQHALVMGRSRHRRQMGRTSGVTSTALQGVFG